MNNRKIIYKERSNKLLKQNEKLHQKIKKLNFEIGQKKAKLFDINDKIADIEDIMELRNEVNEILNGRINALKLHHFKENFYKYTKQIFCIIPWYYS